jgi:hypothetical protein
MSSIDLLILFASSITILLGIYSNNVQESNLIGKYIADSLIISMNFLICLLVISIYIRSQLAVSTFGKIVDI